MAVRDAIWNVFFFYFWMERNLKFSRSSLFSFPFSSPRSSSSSTLRKQQLAWNASKRGPPPSRFSPFGGRYYRTQLSGRKADDNPPA